MLVYLYKNLNFSKTKAGRWLLYWPVLYPEESNSLRERGSINVGLFHWPPISTENLHADTTSSDKFVSISGSQLAALVLFFRRSAVYFVPRNRLNQRRGKTLLQTFLVFFLSILVSVSISNETSSFFAINKINGKRGQMMKKPQPAVRNRGRFPFPLKLRKWKKRHVSLYSVILSFT